ncbi:MAG TPA: glucose-1-phosphate adenylyltransferase [Verrucomicrobiae bacterium]|nr:glucose-1-phosphate adenylyltransferase [Verrucomicrobiae bacterium]
MAPLGLKPITRMNVLGVVMGGGEGRRLFPLTKERSKPAVPIAGKYRLVDIPISNCINSNIRHIYILTQFNSASLHRHIHQTYSFDRFSRGFVEVLAAQQTLGGASWYQGTADAVRQNLRYLTQEQYEYIIILSGDQLYRMDFRKVLQQHLETYADITVATIPVKRSEVSQLGILQVNEEKRVMRFAEKPKDPALLDELKIHDPLLSYLRITSSEDQFLASMGIYVFNREILRKVLDNDKTDFGKHIIPDAIGRHRVSAYIFQGYWEDVGNIRTFFEANLALCSLQPSFNFFDRDAPVYTHARFLPASKVIDSHVSKALIADGCVILRSRVETSIIGVRSFIGAECELRDTIIMGSDFYETSHEILEEDSMGIPHMSIGRGSKIQRAIIDKNVHIGEGVVISDRSGAPDFDGPNYYIREGIVVIPKNAVIPAGTKI